jgi:hypothetical protein
MSKPQHFKTMTRPAIPAASELSEQLEAGWEAVAIVNGAPGSFTTYFKRVAAKEGRADGA